jgi:hypothetical protein
MKITREQLRNIVGEVLQEEKDYQSFFQAMLKKHGVSSPDEFKSDEEKKAFFNKVEDTWKGVSERLVQLKEDELTAKQQKIDLNKNGKVDGDDLSKLRGGAKTEAELSAAQQKIDLNKNGKVDGSDLSKLRAGAKTEAEVEEPTSLTKILSKEGETLVKSGAGKMYNITKVNEGKYDSDLDKIEAAVKGATSFMNVGTELKKAGIKYDFTTSMIPMYMIKVSGNTIAIVNKKYAAGAEKTVGDIAIGLLN